MFHYFLLIYFMIFPFEFLSSVSVPHGDTWPGLCDITTSMNWVRRPAGMKSLHNKIKTPGSQKSAFVVPSGRFYLNKVWIIPENKTSFALELCKKKKSRQIKAGRSEALFCWCAESATCCCWTHLHCNMWNLAGFHFKITYVHLFKWLQIAQILLILDTLFFPLDVFYLTYKIIPFPLFYFCFYLHIFLISDPVN